MTYRSDIEGLRGVAVLAVVLYHSRLGVAPGGFIGVDVFFVLSGFLITGILYGELINNGRVYLADFWARRARRILPAATLVLLVSAIGVLIFASQFEIRHAAWSIAGASAFIINWWLAEAAVNYLSQAAPPNIVLHFWSLAVEEQFYVFWPLVITAVLLLHRRVPKIPLGLAFKVLTVIFWILSFSACIYLTMKSAPDAFFGTIPRAWQLLTGAFIVFVAPREPKEVPYLSEIVGWFGLAAIVSGIFLLSNAPSYPGWWALMPTLGTAGVILSGNSGMRGPARLLSVPPLRFIGRVSYSFYLWHWPFIWFGEYLQPHLTVTGRLALLAGALATGTASYYFVENPVRFNRMLVRSAPMSLVVGVALVDVTFGLMLLIRQQFMLPEAVLYFHDGRTITTEQVAKDLPTIFGDGCLMIDATKVNGEPCVFGKASGTPTVVLFGDSHAAQFFPALEIAAVQMGWRILVRTKGLCSPVDSPQWHPDLKRNFFECATWRANVLTEIAAIRPRLVITASYSDYTFLDSSGGLLAPAQVRRPLAAGTRRLANRLLASSANVIFLRDTPQLPEDPVRCLARHPGHEEECHWDLNAVRPSQQFPVEADRLDPRVTVADLDPIICPEGICWAVRDDRVQMFDFHHLAATASEKLSPQFAGMLRRASVQR